MSNVDMKNMDLPLSIIVAGEHPEDLMSCYDESLKVKPYVVFKYKDRKKIQEWFLNFSKNQLRYDTGLGPSEKMSLMDRVDEVSAQSPEDFYNDYTEDYDHDPDTGDAISNANPDGKWREFKPGGLNSVPFKTHNGSELFATLKGNVNWDAMHGFGTDLYEDVWDIILNGKEPVTPTQKTVAKNMAGMENYLKEYGSKDVYVKSMTSFWAFAFLSKDTGWAELEEGENQYQWMTSYYSRFLKNLPDDTPLTIYEYKK